MTLLSAETRAGIETDLAAWRQRQDDAKRRLAVALEGLNPNEARHLLEGALYYGWRQADGEWHPSVYATR